MTFKDLAITIYAAMPYSAQSFLFRKKAKEKSFKRLKGNYQKYLKRYVNLWEAEYFEVKEYQQSELISIMLSAGRHSAWYSRIFQEAGVKEADIKNNPYEALSTLPLLKKEDIRNHLDAIAIKKENGEKPIETYTSGTTGSPMKCYTNADSEQRLHAIKQRFRHTAGVPINHTGVRFSGNQIISLKKNRPPFWHYNPYEKVWFFSLYHLRRDTLPTYIEKLNQIRPNLLDGYPSGINALATYINNHYIELSFIPDAICTTAEPLTPHIRNNIETAFKCKVYNQYSTSEGALFITECRAGNLHVNSDTGVAEFFNDRGEYGKEGETCELIVTSFINQKTPLIRYKTGDWFKLGSQTQKCSCGCRMPVVDSIFGRDEDYLVDENGIEQGMVSYRIFKKARNIIKAQVIQTAANSVNLKIVKDDEYSANDEKYLQAKMKEVLGESINVTFNYCKDIETGPNGKFKSVIRSF